MIEFLLMVMENEEDEAKFNLLYEKYKKLVFFVARKYFKSEFDVEDAAYSALLKVALNISKVGDIDANETKNFIVVVTKNVCLNMLEKSKKSKEVSFEDIADMSSKDNVQKSIEETELFEIYQKCLLQLSEKQYDVLYMKYVKHLSVKEISNLFSEKENVVSQRIFVGKQNLAKLIREEIDI